ncbi:MAG TPA: DUF1684 domain-containing protein [Chloroflexia bacterium]|nr:DUF1684 domain-containing protein [Chloroflexia bacterium]
MDEANTPLPTWLDLYDYRLRVVEMYRERATALRAGEDGAAVCARFRAKKDALFATHPQSVFTPEDRLKFDGLRYFPYNPDFRVEALLESVEDAEEFRYATGDSQITPLRRAAKVTCTLANSAVELAVFWIDVYGGGLFLPFRDLTCPDESYGGGRYLFDTIKGSDFIRIPGGALASDGTDVTGYAGGPIILDFNYAYNPSCAYDSRWVCPLAPRENWLHVPVRAGERKYHE